MNWKWKETHETWVLGEPDLGCGVYETDKGWEGNVVIFNMIYGMPLRDTKEEAMTAAEERFGKQYHEDVN